MENQKPVSVKMLQLEMVNPDSLTDEEKVKMQKEICDVYYEAILAFPDIQPKIRINCINLLNDLMWCDYKY